MSILKKPLIVQYWTKNPLYNTPLFGSVMSRNRFQLLLSMQHFTDNIQQPSCDDPLRDKLFKLRPVVDHLFEHFQLIYSMSQNVCIDEFLLLWKGRLHFKQYIPIKCSRFGVKLFKLCESSSGYIYSLKIYVGKDNLLQFPPAPGVPLPPTQFGPTERIVWFLMLPISKKGHHLYVDNYYISIPLFTALLMPVAEI